MSSRVVDSTQSTKDITHLEALCESRTKELNYARLQLKQGAAGFQAMTVLVQYLSYEVRSPTKHRNRVVHGIREKKLMFFHVTLFVEFFPTY